MPPRESRAEGGRREGEKKASAPAENEQIKEYEDEYTYYSEDDDEYEDDGEDSPAARPANGEVAGQALIRVCSEPPSNTVSFPFGKSSSGYRGLLDRCTGILERQQFEREAAAKALNDRWCTEQTIISNLVDVAKQQGVQESAREAALVTAKKTIRADSRREKQRLKRQKQKRARGTSGSEVDQRKVKDQHRRQQPGSRRSQSHHDMWRGSHGNEDGRTSGDGRWGGGGGTQSGWRSGHGSKGNRSNGHSFNGNWNCGGKGGGKSIPRNGARNTGGDKGARGERGRGSGGGRGRVDLVQNQRADQGGRKRSRSRSRICSRDSKSRRRSRSCSSDSKLRGAPLRVEGVARQAGTVLCSTEAPQQDAGGPKGDRESQGGRS